MAAQECATLFQNGHPEACGNMQQAPTAGTEFGPFEDIGRVAIAEMVVTKTPDSREVLPIRDQHQRTNL